MKVYNTQNTNQINTSQNAGKSVVDKNGFLKILVAQLQNQDPMNTQDNSQYVAQMAQFSSLEEMQNMNAGMTKLLSSTEFMEGSSMIGKIAKISDGDSGYITGQVTGAKLVNGMVNITIDSKDYDISNVVEVTDKGSGNNVV